MVKLRHIAIIIVAVIVIGLVALIFTSILIDVGPSLLDPGAPSQSQQRVQEESEAEQQRAQEEFEEEQQRAQEEFEDQNR
jgi:hypothetical protein